MNWNPRRRRDRDPNRPRRRRGSDPRPQYPYPPGYSEPTQPNLPLRRPDLPPGYPPEYAPGPYPPQYPPDYPPGQYPQEIPPYQYPPGYPPPAPPGSYGRYARRRKRVGCLGMILRIVFAISLFVGLFSCLLVTIYVIAPPPRTNVLVLGLDARPGEGYVTRSDTIILATVDPDQPYVGMLGIPRDLYLNIPGYGENRINAAHILGESEYEGGGVDLAEQTIEENFGVEVHRTLRMNFQAFVAIVDAAGGLDINVEDYIYDDLYPTPDFGTMVIEFQPGLQHMDGERALIYARTRHGASDFERAERQQQVIAALVQKLANPVNWWRLPGVYLAFTTNVDTDLTIIDAILLAPAVAWVGPDGIDRQVLTREMAQTATLDNGASVLDPNWGSISALLDIMFRR